MRTSWLLALLVALGAQPTSIGRLSEALSEPGGNFDSDNLISNEAAYLDAMPALERSRLKGGVYIGVGPEQNFSYVAALEPSLALIVDLRRDNLLEHLLLKALFEQATDRASYLALLLGREIPRLEANAPIEAIVKAVERAPRVELDEAGLAKRITGYGFTLDKDDYRTISRFWRMFAKQGFRLKFESFNRGPRAYHPDWRELVLARDPKDRYSGLFGSDAAFQRVKRMQAENRIVPVTGNLAGKQAMAAIARYLRDGKLALNAVYVSNVEQYLFRERGVFEQYLGNLRALPRSPDAVIIRSLFGPYAQKRARAGLYSAQEVERLDAFLGRRSGSYQDVIRFGVE